MQGPSFSGRYPLKQAVINATLLGDNTVVAAVSGKSIRVISMFFTTDTALSIQWKSGTTAISGSMDLAISGGMAIESDQGLMWTSEGEALVLNLSAAGVVGGTLTYVEVD